MSKRIAILAAQAVFALAPAFAQQSGLVNVDVQNVANNIAQNLRIDVSQIPLTVQVPIGVAANVCGVAANVLAQQAAGASCTATSTSTALERQILQQIRRS